MKTHSDGETETVQPNIPLNVVIVACGDRDTESVREAGLKTGLESLRMAFAVETEKDNFLFHDIISLEQFQHAAGGDVDAAFIFFGLKAETWKNYAEIWRSHEGQFSIVLCEEDPDVVFSVINARLFSHVGTITLPAGQLVNWLKEAARASRRVVAKTDLMRRVAAQNRKLEDLRSNLEKMVVDRTQHLEYSKAKSDEKQKATRDLVRFLRDLSQVDAIGDLLELIRKDLRRTPGLMDPVLVYRSSPQSAPQTSTKWRVACFRSSTLQSTALKTSVLAHRTIQVNDTKDQVFLANQLGRPVTRVIAVPMIVPHARAGVTGILYIEHNLTYESAVTIAHDLVDRYQPVAVTLDRILLTYSLSKASTYWEKTFDAIPSPIAIIDEGFQVFRANQHFVRHAGSPLCHEQLFQSSQRCEGCPVAQVLVDKVPARVEFRRGDRIFEVSSFPIIFGDERATTVVNHYLDVTDDRKFYGQVLQNEKMIALGLLAGNLAHELNNPLTGMRSMAQLLMEDATVPDRVREDLKEIESAVGRSQNIVRNLLEFSQPTQEDEIIPCTWNHIVELTLPVVKLATRDHNRDVELDPAPPLFLGHPQMLSQVVFNFVNNACQAMTEPGTVSVVTRHTDTHAILEVRDTGVGISETVLKKIFTPFFTTKPSGQGTGLGLSMSMNIVKKLGGQIRVTSEVGQGTTFYVELPIQDQGREHT